MPWSIRNSIFDSWSEEEVHRSLVHRWLNKFNLFDHQPILNVLSIDLNELPSLERELAKKLSFDFTFTTKTGRPILSVEYDGLGQGFSTFSGWELLARKFTDATGYHPSRIDVGRDAHRRDKMNFKVRAAAEAFYPVLVVSAPEVRDLAPGLDVSLLDAMIGGYLAGVRFKTEADEYISKLDPEGQFTDEQIQDQLVSIELEIDYEEDPLSKLAGEIQEDLFERGVATGYWVSDESPKYDPANPFEPLWVEGRVQRDPVWVGASWSTDVDGVGRIETRFANRRISFLGYSSEVLYWRVLELLHSLRIRNALLRAGKLPPVKCPWCGGPHLAKDHPRTA